MYTILLPTYNRPELALRSIKSVISQTHTDWNLLLIIDDSVSDYKDAIHIANQDSRIMIIKNTENIGKNASLNRALSSLESKNYAGYIVFLDDDDWLTPECLSDFAKFFKHNWIVSERYDVALRNKLTWNNVKSNKINYIKDMLLLKHFKGETTHCIFFPPVSHIRFPTLIKNAEEWIYFASISKYLGSFLYLSITGTLTEGYLVDGLSTVRSSRADKIRVLTLIYREVWRRKFFSLYIYIYLVGRTIKTTLG